MELTLKVVRTLTRFEPKVGQIGPKWDKSGNLSDRIPVLFDSSVSISINTVSEVGVSRELHPLNFHQNANNKPFKLSTKKSDPMSCV